MKGTLLALIVVLAFAGCGPITEYDGVFDPDAVDVDEDVLLEVDEEIIEEQ